MKLVAILASLFALALSESNDCEALGCNYYPKDGVSKLINCKEDGSRVSVIFYGDNNCNWSGFVDIDISPNNICCSQVSEPESETPTLPIGRIVGGQSVTYDKYPFMALLNGGSCGGSILRKSSPAMILTAAHCYQAFTGTVKLGADSLNDNTNVVTSAIKSFIIHPDYGFDLNHDIAILWLEKDISSQTQFKQILPITKVLAGSECCNDGADLQVIGYGDDLNFQPTPTLEYVDVDYVKRSTCNTAYSGGITNNMICAASPGKDSCLGDSGGPLIKKGTLQQVGIVSWGESCAHPTKPGVYVELGRYLEWINLYQQQNIPPQVISAEVSMVCDNDGEYSVSQDGGKTFKSSPYIYSNPIPDNGGNDLWLDASFPVSKVSSNTVIKFKCTDTDNNGGFMATIRYKGKQFSTKQGSNYKLGDGSTTGITYKARSAAPWLDRLQANVGADAQFMWNGQNSNTMEFKFDFGSLSETSNSAEVIVSCDDIGTYYRSDNDGISYTQIIGKSDKWMLPVSMIITSITDKTKLKFVCKDNGVIGGFIGTVRYKGKEYSTTNPINNGHFKLIGTNSGLIYNPKLTKPWTEVTSSFSGNKWVDNSKLISNDAYWIWDGNVGNTKEFSFDFGDIINL